MKHVKLTSKEIARQKRAAEQLDAIPKNGSLRMILDAISVCVPVAAGIVQSVNDAALPMLSGHCAGLPVFILEAWMSAPRAHLDRALGPLIRHRVGDFWVSEELAKSVQQSLAVLGQLGAYAFGEGAGYKILKRPSPRGGSEHVWLGLVSAPETRFDARAGLLLRDLTPAVRKAVLRVRLPIVAMRPLAAQLVDENDIGSVVLTPGGDVIETNREAHEFAQHYGAATGAQQHGHMLANLLGSVRAHYQKVDARELDPGPYLIPRLGKVLEVRRHLLRAAAHGLAQDVVLLLLHERIQPDTRSHRPIPPPPRDVALSNRQQEIAELLIHSGFSYEGIAAKLGISSGTVRTFVSQIYKMYVVHDRDALVTLADAWLSNTTPKKAAKKAKKSVSKRVVTQGKAMVGKVGRKSSP